MKKLLGIVVFGLLLSGNAYAGLFDNKFLPSKEAKEFCMESVYTGLFSSMANADKTDEHKKIMYKECIRDYYED